MKSFLAVSILALATNLAFGGSNYTSGTNTSLSNFERGDPDEYQRVFPDRAFAHAQAPKLTALDQFEKGDPDEAVLSSDAGSAKQDRLAKRSVTSLAAFERGDPDESPML